MGEIAVTDEDVRIVWNDPRLRRKAAAMWLGVTLGELTGRARRLGLPMRPQVHRQAVTTRVTDDRVRDLWLRADLTRQEQAREAGLALSALTARASRLGLPTRRSAADRRVPAARIREVWLDPGLTVQQAADGVGLGPASLRRRADAMGLAPRGRRGRPVVAVTECEPLFRKMWEAQVRADEMAAHFGVQAKTVSRHARRLGLARRAPPSRPISLDRFWVQRHKKELRTALSAAAHGENAALRRQQLDDEADDHAPARPVVQRRVLRDVARRSG